MECGGCLRAIRPTEIRFTVHDLKYEHKFYLCPTCAMIVIKDITWMRSGGGIE